jgi:hypothetical protein
MLRKLDDSSGNIIGFKLSGKITDREFKAFAAEVEKTVTDKGKVKLLLITDYPQEFSLKAIWDELVFWTKHIEEIERLAIVGQKEWEKWLGLLEHTFISTEVRYYNKSRLKEAWTWLKS